MRAEALKVTTNEAGLTVTFISLRSTVKAYFQFAIFTLTYVCYHTPSFPSAINVSHISIQVINVALWPCFIKHFRHR